MLPGQTRDAVRGRREGRISLPQTMGTAEHSENHGSPAALREEAALGQQGQNPGPDELAKEGNTHRARQ